MTVHNFHHLTVELVAENAALITWPECISPLQHQEIIELEKTIKKVCLQGIIESIVSYNSLILYYNFQMLPVQKLLTMISSSIDSLISLEKKQVQQAPSPKVIEIPVLYNHQTGWDLATIAKQKECSIEEIIHWHSQIEYRAYALGFTPGFCYLGKLDARLITARKSTPRLNVPKGAIAIADEQTAVYPNQSPGGWHIIGQTPSAMYQIINNDFTPLISVGDRVKFTPVDQQTFESLGGVVTLETTRKNHHE